MGKMFWRLGPTTEVKNKNKNKPTTTGEKRNSQNIWDYGTHEDSMAYCSINY